MKYRHGTGIKTEDGLHLMSWGGTRFEGKPFFVLKYFPEKNGERTKNRTSYSKVKPPLYAYNEMIDTAEEFDEDYVSYSDLLDRKIVRVPEDKIEKIIDPVEKANKIIEDPSDSVEKEFETVHSFFSDLMNRKEIDLEIGVTASLLFGLHDPDSSDIDIIFYGDSENVEKLLEEIKGLVEKGTLELELSDFEKNVVEETMDTDLTESLREKLVDEKRYLSSFHYEKTSLEIHLMFARPEINHDITDGNGKGRTSLEGTITDKSSSKYVCPRFKVKKDRESTVICYHKSGAVVKQGDNVSLSGYKVVEGDRELILQLDERQDYLRVK